jgi:flavin-binding protein dodecin
MPFLLPFSKKGRGYMNSEGRAARTTEIIASSPRSFQDAVTVGFQRASKTLRGITGLKVSDQRCRVEDGKIVEYRVTLEVIFILEERHGTQRY